MCVFFNVCTITVGSGGVNNVEVIHKITSGMRFILNDLKTKILLHVYWLIAFKTSYKCATVISTVGAETRSAVSLKHSSSRHCAGSCRRSTYCLDQQKYFGSEAREVTSSTYSMQCFKKAAEFVTTAARWKVGYCILNQQSWQSDLNGAYQRSWAGSAQGSLLFLLYARMH